MKIALVSVFVDDPVGKAYKFYTEKLGFKSRMYIPEAYLAIVASPEEPDGTGLLLEPNDSPIAKNYQDALYSAGLPCITMGVDDVQKEYKRLKNLGVKFKQEPTKNDWGTDAIFDDTCGNYIQIAQV